VLTSDVGRERSTISSHTNASYRFGNAVLAVAVLSDFNQTPLQVQDFGVTLTRSYTASFGYAVTPLLDTTLRGSYNENSFTGVGNSEARPDATAYSATASVAWRPRRWLSLGLDYTYSRYIRGFTSSTGSGSGGPATENRASASLRASF